MYERKLAFAILKTYFLKVTMGLEQIGYKRSTTLEFLQLGQSTLKSRQQHRPSPSSQLQSSEWTSCKQQALLSYCYVYHLVGDTR